MFLKRVVAVSISIAIAVSPVEDPFRAFKVAEYFGVGAVAASLKAT